MKLRQMLHGIFFIIIFSAIIRAAPGDADLSFNPQILLDGTPCPFLYTVRVQPNGKSVVGGLFDTCNGASRNLIARFGADDTLDATFTSSFTKQNGNIQGIVQDLVILPDGKILFGGSFVRINGAVRGSIARLNSDGSLDAFHPNPNGANNNVYAPAVQADKKVLIAGNFEWVGDFGDVSRTGFARLLDDNQPPVPPATGKIVFNSRPDGINLEIYSINPDGSNLTRLTTNDTADYDPSLTAEGSRIAFVSDRDENDEIYIMNSDGTGQTRLTNNDLPDLNPALSPDGSKIAFASLRDGNWEIYTMNSDGTNQTRLTNNSFRDEEPSFSPDGNKIVFRSNRDGNSEIYVMDVNGSNQIRLTNNIETDTEPVFSPDGAKIAFRTFRDGNSEVYVMNSDGANPVNLTNNPAIDGQPTYSPDGLRIAFMTERHGAPEIYVMNSDGSNSVRITNNSIDDSRPSWGGQAGAPPPAPPTKLKIAGGNILIGSPGQGIILKSPGGACKLLSIDNAGAMVLTDAACP